MRHIIDGCSNRGLCALFGPLSSTSATAITLFIMAVVVVVVRHRHKIARVLRRYREEQPELAAATLLLVVIVVMFMLFRPPPPPPRPPPPPPSPPPWEVGAQNLRATDIAVGVHCGGPISKQLEAVDMAYITFAHRFGYVVFYGDGAAVAPLTQQPLVPWPQAYYCGTPTAWGASAWPEDTESGFDAPNGHPKFDKYARCVQWRFYYLIWETYERSPHHAAVMLSGARS